MEAAVAGRWICYLNKNVLYQSGRAIAGALKNSNLDSS